MKRFLKWTAAILAVLLVAAGGAVGYAYHQFTKPGPLEKPVAVVIPKGATVTVISDRLKQSGVIDNRFIFRTWVRLYRTRTKLRAGEFEFPKGTTQRGAMNILISGKQVLRRFGVPEGLTTYEILERLAKHEPLKGSITVKAGEGELLPDTYFYTLGETKDQMVQRMRDAMRKAVNEAWAARQKGLPIKTKEQMIVLASIIEKETSVAAERRRVAAVFVNRLRKGMKLQTDPTVIYGLTEGKGPLGRRLLLRDLKAKHPYNTYVIDGLPPGPIANPGLASLKAAVNPIVSKELYFVADGTGGHAFAETLREHQRNVAKWRRIRAQREKTD